MDAYECLCGIKVCFKTSEVHPTYDESKIRINTPDDAHIGEHVWIGQRTTILKGIQIGYDSMIGTMSLVNKSFRESNSLIAGMPAKLLRLGIR